MRIRGYRLPFLADFFFFAMEEALLSRFRDFRGLLFPLAFPIYDILYFSPAGNWRKFLKACENPRSLAQAWDSPRIHWSRPLALGCNIGQAEQSEHPSSVDRAAGLSGD